jgi:hypothetical protein
MKKVFFLKTLSKQYYTEMVMRIQNRLFLNEMNDLCNVNASNMIKEYNRILWDVLSNVTKLITCVHFLLGSFYKT